MAWVDEEEKGWVDIEQPQAKGWVDVEPTDFKKTLRPDLEQQFEGQGIEANPWVDPTGVLAGGITQGAMTKGVGALGKLATGVLGTLTGTVAEPITGTIAETLEEKLPTPIRPYASLPLGVLTGVVGAKAIETPIQKMMGRGATALLKTPVKPVEATVEPPVAPKVPEAIPEVGVETVKALEVPKEGIKFPLRQVPIQEQSDITQLVKGQEIEANFFDSMTMKNKFNAPGKVLRVRKPDINGEILVDIELSQADRLKRITIPIEDVKVFSPPPESFKPIVPPKEVPTETFTPMVSPKEKLLYEQKGLTPQDIKQAEKIIKRPIGEEGSVTLNTLTGGIPAFVKEDVIPSAKKVAQTFMQAGDDIKGILAPMSRGETAKVAGGALRENIAGLEIGTVRAHKALEEAKSLFNRMPDEANFDFYNRMETGRGQDIPALEPIARKFRETLDPRRDAIRALGTGKLEQFNENYMPHYYKEFTKEGRIYGKKPLQGSASFLKQRTFNTLEEARAAGLTPISSNPVDLVLFKAREMDKYLMAHKTINELKDIGMVKFVKAGHKPPEGYTMIDDRISRVTYRNESGEMVNSGNYYVPEEAARLFNASSAVSCLN